MSESEAVAPSPTSQPNQDGNNLRRHDRYGVETDIKIHLTDKEDLVVVSKDVAAGGLCAISPKPFVPGHRFEITIHPNIRRDAEVVWCKQIKAPKVSINRSQSQVHYDLEPGVYEFGLKYLAASEG